MVDYPMGGLPDEDAAHLVVRWVGRGRKGDTPMSVSRTSAPLIDFEGLPRDGRKNGPKKRMTIR